LTVEIHPIRGIAEVVHGDDLAELLIRGLAESGIELADRDVVVVTHKVVSKAEGAVVQLVGDDPDAHRAVVEEEAVSILRRRGELIIAETRHGFVCANAGVDRSNVPPGWAVLHPRDPDHSAERLRRRLSRATGAEVAVVITDTFGRAWRRGLADVAIGVAGMPAILDLRGTPDATGRLLEVTEIALADEVAAAADLAIGKATGIPAAVVRGLTYPPGRGRAADLVRPIEEDLFR
jgi:coenzyme F420-0:L-glutamate ligase / coenzyme F420-1:gamma-L-glutamate ligase